MRIGKLKLENNTILAPLAGITNLPFRRLAREAGCALVCSEMISANGLVRATRKTEKMLDSTPAEKPLSVQIFGADPAIMAEAAAIVQAATADIVDINFGCSVKKVIKTGAGAALMRTLPAAEVLLKAVRDAIRIPLTIKIRTGWERSGQQAVQLAQIAETCGVDAITVHPRTATQGFGGRADWSVIRAVKQQVGVPVIGNGDIFTAEDALKMLQETGCDAVMVGRRAIGNPMIFPRILARLAGRRPPPEDLAQRFEIMLRYLENSVAYCGEKKACYMMRSRLGWFTRGLRHSSRFRQSLNHLSSRQEALALIENYRQALTAEADA